MIDFKPVNLQSGRTIQDIMLDIKSCKNKIVNAYSLIYNEREVPPLEPRHAQSLCVNEDAAYCAIIITGPARNGKSTMVDVFNRLFPTLLDTSIVNPIYQVCELLLTRDERIEVNEYLKTKNDDWRQFMFEMKEAYRKYCNGPLHYVHNVIMRRTIDLANDKASNPHIICVQSRETYDINALKDMFTEMGIIPIVVYISGQTTEEDWKNDSDHNTDSNIADIIIKNDNTIESFEDVCLGLCSLIKTEMSNKNWPKLLILDQIALINKLSKL